MRQNIGQVTLTRNQMDRLSELHGGKVLGFKVSDEGVEVNATEELNQGEVTALLAQLSALEDKPVRESKGALEVQADNANTIGEVKELLKAILKRIA